MRLTGGKESLRLPEFGWEDLPHDEEGHVGVTSGEGDDKYEETGQREPTQSLLNLLSVDFKHVEEGTESSQGDSHTESGDEEQYPAPGPIHHEHGKDGGQQLNDSHDDG